MPTCQLCNKKFPNRIVVEGKTHVVNNRRMCLECSPWGQHNTRSAKRIIQRGSGLHKCPLCKETLPPENFYLQSNGRRYVYCKDCDRKRQLGRQHKFKKNAVAYKGGTCIICGYGRCLAALTFHHLDPTQKDFGFASYAGKFTERVIQELDKCVLLCCRCHTELHAGMVTLD